MSLRTLLALALTITLCGCSAESAPHASDDVKALVDVNLIDGTGGPVREGVTILIRGNRIEGVLDPGQPLPDTAEQLDLGGRYVMPGLIDAHVHLKTQPRPDGMIEAVLEAALMGGVTTVRDMGGAGGALVELARAERTGAPSPRILYSQLVTGSGSRFWLEGPAAEYVAGSASPGTTFGFRQVLHADLIEEIVEQAVEQGAAGLKLHSGLEPEITARLIAAARRRGLEVWGHANLDQTRPDQLVALGPDIISHADMLAYAGQTQTTAPVLGGYIERTTAAMNRTPVDGPVLAALFEAMRTNGVSLDPTLMVMGDSEDGRAYRAWVASATRRAHESGVRIVAGTDALGGSSPNLHRELQLLVERAGMTPLEAIRAATFDSAAALGRDDLGMVAPGRRADLVVLSVDPSLDIANTLTVQAVIKDGVVRRRQSPMPVPPGARAPAAP